MGETLVLTLLRGVCCGGENTGRAQRSVAQRDARPLIVFFIAGQTYDTW